MKPQDLLVLFPKALYCSKMSMVRRRVIDYLVSQGAMLSGQGWDNWNNEKGIDANIAWNFRNTKFVFTYKPLGQSHGAIQFPPLRWLNQSPVPICMSYNECWDQLWTEQEVIESNTDLIIHHHQADEPRLLNLVSTYGKSIVHIPHCADPYLFLPKSKPWEEREIDVILTGVLSKEIYPLRSRFFEALRTGSVKGRTHIHSHPGYRLPDLTACKAQEKQYAKLLGDSKISLVCGSKYGYGLAKYVESFMAGCYVVGDDVPDFPACDYSVISDLTEPEDLAKSINSILEQQATIQDVASFSQKAAAKHYTMEQYCSQLLIAMSNHLITRKK